MDGGQSNNAYVRERRIADSDFIGEFDTSTRWRGNGKSADIGPGFANEAGGAPNDSDLH